MTDILSVLTFTDNQYLKKCRYIGSTYILVNRYAMPSLQITFIIGMVDPPKTRTVNSTIMRVDVTRTCLVSFSNSK